MIKRFIADESGATAVEYGILVAVLCIGIAAAFTKLAGTLQILYQNNTDRVSAVMQ